MSAHPSPNRSPRSPRSLRRTLFTYLLPALTVALALNTVVTYRTALESANQAYDRTLHGALLSISEKVWVNDGRLAIDLPYAAFDMLESNFQDRVFYRIRHAEQGEISGYADLPLPPADAPIGKPFFFVTTYRDEPLRVAALWRPVYDPAIHAPLLIEIGETQLARQQLARQLLLESLLKEGLLVLAGALFLAWGVQRALRPLRRLRHEVEHRADDDLTPLAASSDLPREVLPLVEAVNLHTARAHRLSDAQRRFLDDAAHQLKTPLAVIRAQADLALREETPERMRAAVGDIARTASHTAQLVQQLLTLARSDATLTQLAPVDLAALAQQVCFDWLQQALPRGIDLGLDGENEQAVVHGDALLLRELLNNLLDNALRYTPDGGTVTVRLANRGNKIGLQVEDSGPGIPPLQRLRVFDRFYRPPGDHTPGNGLGLAIVKAVVERHGGRIELGDSRREADGRATGLCVSIELPAAEPAQATD